LDAQQWLKTCRSKRQIHKYDTIVHESCYIGRVFTHKLIQRSVILYQLLYSSKISSIWPNGPDNKNIQKYIYIYHTIIIYI
jgi:hypothetical protein